MQVLALLYLLTGFTYLLAVKGTYPWVFLNYYPKPGETDTETLRITIHVPSLKHKKSTCPHSRIRRVLTYASKSTCPHLGIKIHVPSLKHLNPRALTHKKPTVCVCARTHTTGTAWNL